uniref:Transposase n=1 Tax=Steinernema glaseri TaxID=37863 RepID=A0A1I7Y3D0_9BILA
ANHGIKPHQSNDLAEIGASSRTWNKARITRRKGGHGSGVRPWSMAANDPEISGGLPQQWVSSRHE